jgi:methyl-accepting chemotaxis protein
MSEQRPRNAYVPLRVRFRSPRERAQWERMLSQHSSPGNERGQAQAATVNAPVSLGTLQDVQHTRQIKELIRLGNILRAELGLDEVLQQIVAAISTCTGFRRAVINLIQEDSEHLSSVAFTGVSAENQQILRDAQDPVEKMARFMRPEFRMSQSYFISHEHAGEFTDFVTVTQAAEDDYVIDTGGWHPDDMFIVPLYSPRKKKLLGFLSLDDPEDGKIPTLESIEAVELFANQAAVAIDSAFIFQEREAERKALEEAIALLRADLEQVQRGDLRVRIRAEHEKIRPLGDAINTMIEEISSILGEVQVVTQAVDEHTRAVQHRSELLVRDASQQEREVGHISLTVEEIATTMNELSERASKLSQVAVEAMDVTLDGQNATMRAVEGMGKVRETTLLSAHVMKRLSESGQEINEAVIAITDLTTRMNLLALNAAIEATRAGEHGQGFAVVAQEIRTLAVNSANSARKIAADIRTIQEQTTAASHSVEQNTHEVVNQTELVTQMGVALDAIGVVTEQMLGLVQSICGAADRQTEGSQVVSGAIEQIAQMTREITQHMRHMQQSLAHMVELTNSLRSRLAFFRISER